MRRTLVRMENGDPRAAMYLPDVGSYELARTLILLAEVSRVAGDAWAGPRHRDRALELDERRRAAPAALSIDFRSG